MKNDRKRWNKKKTANDSGQEEMWERFELMIGSTSTLSTAFYLPLSISLFNKWKIWVRTYLTSPSVPNYYRQVCVIFEFVVTAFEVRSSWTLSQVKIKDTADFGISFNYFHVTRESSSEEKMIEKCSEWRKGEEKCMRSRSNQGHSITHNWNWLLLVILLRFVCAFGGLGRRSWEFYVTQSFSSH